MRHALAIALLLAGSAAYAQSQSRPITLDVVVDRSTRARLSAADFVVNDGGQPVAIDSARLVEAAAGGAPLQPVGSSEDERTAAEQASRIVGIFVDEYHLADDGSLAAARSALARFVRDKLGPRDLVVLVRPLDSLLALRLTADREAVASAIEAVAGRLGDYTPRSTFEQNFFAGAPARIDAARNQVALSSISALVSHLGQFGGRKTLLVVSNALPGAARAGGLLPGVDSIVRAANRGRVAVYALRPSSASAAATVDAAQSGSPDPLPALTSQTTGFTIDGVDRIDAGLARVLQDASDYYELTLTPPPQASDGRYRAVSVTVRTPGTAIRARSGYAVAAPPSPVPAVGSSVIPPGLRIARHVSPLIRTWFGQSAGGAAGTKVDFVWEAAPRVPGDRGRTPTPARVTLKVITLDGTDLFTGSSAPSRSDMPGLPTEVQQLSFDAPAGPIVLQMDILDAAGQAIDHDVRDLSVAPFRGSLSFGSVAVFRARTARQVRDLVEGQDSAPAVARQFSRAEHLVLRAPVVSRAAKATVTARLASGFGTAIRELPVRMVGQDGDTAQVDMPLAPLASGAYQVEFTARAGTATTIERTQFVVTP